MTANRPLLTAIAALALAGAAHPQETGSHVASMGEQGFIPKLSKRDSEGGFPNRRVSDSRWRAQEVRHAHSTSG
jgi:hypothetical protein